MKNPYRIASEVACRMLSYQKLSVFKDIIQSNHKINKFCETLSYKKSLTETIKVNNCLLIRSGKKCVLTAEENILLDHPTHCTAFEKFVLNGTRYTTATYQSKCCKKNNDSVVKMNSGEIGCITRILVIDKKGTTDVVLFVRIFELENDAFIVNTDVTVDHIKKCYDIDGYVKIFKPKHIVGQCTLIKLSNIYYISLIPKGCLGE